MDPPAPSLPGCLQPLRPPMHWHRVYGMGPKGLRGTPSAFVVFCSPVYHVVFVKGCLLVEGFQMGQVFFFRR